MTITEEQVLDQLESLGDTADDVFDTLEQLNIKGKRGVAHSCPISNYMTYLNGRHGFSVYDHLYWDTQQYDVVKVPKQVFKFLCSFDDGKYPELET